MNNSKKRDSYEVNNNENPERPADGESRRGATTVSASEWRGVLNFKANLMNLPYFKFMVQDYLSGDIQACSMQTQGIYINLMARIWKKKGSLDTSQAPLAKLLRVTEQELLDSINELLDMGILIKNKDGSISVKFLLKQIDEINEDHERNVEMGRKGGLKSAQLRSRGGQPPLNHTDTESETETETETETHGHALHIQGHEGSLDDANGEKESKKPKKPVKEAYGEFKKVLLTAEEHRKLIDTHGTGRAAKAIEILDGYIASKGAKYVSHYAVFKSDSWIWGRVDEGKSSADRRREEKAAKEGAEPDYSKLIRSY